MNADVSDYHIDKGWETGRSAVADQRHLYAKTPSPTLPPKWRMMAGEC
jgi:hypothetical protein